EQAERMREANLVREDDLVAFAVAVSGGAPFADAVHGDDGGLVEGRWKERAGGVRLVMVGEDVAALVLAAESLIHLARQMQLFLQPHRQRHAERAITRRRERQIGLQQALELLQRLVVEADVAQFAWRNAGFGEAIVDRVDGEAGIMLDAREAFFLRGG